MLSIVIPAYNEEHRIGPTLQELSSVVAQRLHEIIVVCDGTDRTPEVAQSLHIKNVRVLSFGHRLGKGGALKKGIYASRGRRIVIYDADGAMPASELPKLLTPLNKYAIVIGSRYSSKARASMSGIRRLTARMFNLLVRLLFGMHFSDTQCGFKAFRAGTVKKLAAQCKQNGFVWDVEMLYLAKKHGVRVKEVAIFWREKSGGVVAQNVVQNMIRIFLDLVSLRLQYV